MAVFCGKCGSPIDSGSKFCPNCGALAPQPAAAPVGAAPPPPSQPWSTPGPQTGMPPAPPQKSGGALKVILIALGVLVVLIVVGLVGAGLFIKKTVLDNVSVKEGPGGKAEVSINTPGGQMKINARDEITEEKLGVAIYPGAKADEGAGSVTFSGEGGKGGMIGGAAFTTSDSVDQVVSFYKGRLGSKATVLETTAEGKHSVVLNVTTQDSWKTIVVEDEGNGTTKISVSNMTGNRPQ
ncbi:MAG: zinc ribbon domain-containing protein [Acidobacteriia bacterium]|nr:zinc ribbon domain-containing protein [Terriglobia bacterium]